MGGRKRVTQKDVAELAGVSFITVSRVVNETGNVKPETCDQVLDAIKELNYYPNNFARGLTSNSIQTIAFQSLVPTGVGVESLSYYHRLLIGIEKVCIAENFDVLLSAQRGLEEDVDYLKPFYERKADGLILIGINSDGECYERIKRDGIPCAVIGNYGLGNDVYSINTDNQLGMRQIAEYLIRNGHRNIAYLHVDRFTWDTSNRLTSFQEVLAENGLEIPENWLLRGDFSKASGVHAVRTLFSAREKPTALVCCTDLMALGAMEGARDLGLRIPEDFSLVGFDGHEIGLHTNPPLATVVQSLEEIGKTAASLVIEQIRSGEHGSAEMVFPGVFEPRGTIQTYEAEDQPKTKISMQRPEQGTKRKLKSRA